MSMVEITSPFDLKPIAKLERIDEQRAFEALDLAHCTYLDRRQWLSPAARIDVLQRFASLVQSRREVLARQAASEGGKPLRDSLVEIDRAIEGTHVAINSIASLTGHEIPMRLSKASAQRFAHTYLEPRGVVCAISAFNHPFNLIIHQVVTAVAAGCPVVVKPATSTPLSCKSIVEMLTEAGLPPGFCQMVFCDNAVAEKLVADGRVAFLTFIGSARVGWHLRSKLAPGATCALEHGGVAPVVIDATADLASAVVLLTRGAFYHAGQVCVSVQRIYLHKDIAQRFTRDFVESAGKLKTGDPLDANTDVGPLISPREVDRIDSWVSDAIAGGAKLLCGGKKLSPTMYAPTILHNPKDDAAVTRQEVFGPVVCLYEVDSVDEAITRANAVESFFQASVFTHNLDTALDASRRLNAMAVMVNDHTAFRVDWMPFGGHRLSGLGVGGILPTMREMSIERMVVFSSPVL